MTGSGGGKECMEPGRLAKQAQCLGGPSGAGWDGNRWVGVLQCRKGE